MIIQHSLLNIKFSLHVEMKFLTQNFFFILITENHERKVDGENLENIFPEF